MAWTPPTRKAISAALLKRVGTAAEFKTIGRRNKGDEMPTEQPALLLGMPDENHIKAGRGLPSKRVLSYPLWLYAKGDGRNDDTAADAIGDILDGLDLALKPDPAVDTANPRETGLDDGEHDFTRGYGFDDVCTLGGLVDECRIDGLVETAEAPTGPSQGFARLNILVVLP